MRKPPGIAGALSDTEYRQKLAAAGFEEVEIEQTRVYDVRDALGFLGAVGFDADAMAPKSENKLISAFVRALRPART